MASHLKSAWKSPNNWSAHFKSADEVVRKTPIFMNGSTLNKKQHFTSVGESNLRNEREEDPKAWLRQAVKRQTLAAPFEKVEDSIVHSGILGGISVIIFDVKLTNRVTLESRWLLMASRDNNNNRFFVRDHALLEEKEPERWEPAIKELNLLRIEQCPHSFHPSIVERCQIYTKSRGWEAVQDPTHLELLLEEVAKLSHLVAEVGLTRDVCEAKQQIFRGVQKYQGSSDDQMQKLLEEGALKKFEIELGSERDDVKNQERIEKWMDGIPDVGLEDAMPSVINEVPDSSTAVVPDCWVHELKAQLKRMDESELVNMSHRFPRRFIEDPEQILKKPADPLVSVLRGEGHEKPTLERNVPFSEVAKFWQDCNAVEAVRHVPSEMFNSEAFIIKTREGPSDVLAERGASTSLELVVFRGTRGKFELDIHDRYLDDLFREAEYCESNIHKLLKWVWFHRTPWLDNFTSFWYDRLDSV
ncbi:hypothetical protein BDZ45DRAFT_737488 [Acephala macrosclerotiorum]|nr:hypothetical protein BDZ45DRAFT_737488 [Acephala macrosclerotiorum]